MRLLSVRLIVGLILGVTLVSLLFSWWQVREAKEDLRNALEHQVITLGESLATTGESYLQAGDRPDFERLLRRFSNREHLLGASVYDLENFPLIKTGLTGPPPEKLPALAQAVRENKVTTTYVRMGFHRLFALAAPLHAADGTVHGGMVLLYDYGYIRSQIFRLWSRVFFRIAVEGLVIVALTLLIVRWSFFGPIARAAQWMKTLRTGKHVTEPTRKDLDFLLPLAREMAPLAETVRQARAAAEIEARLRNTNESLWTAQRLADYVRTKLDGSNLFVVSNREPYVHMRDGENIKVTVPASGLVTAIEPILKACHGTWIAQGSGDADRETVDDKDRLQVPPEDPRYTLRRLWINKEEEEGFYYGFANEGLWPLCHMAHNRPTFRKSDWDYYTQINTRFADALVEEIGEEQNPVVLIQDYHFALLPRMVKERIPHARVAIFWHIPWPNAESFSICPWQQELLDGLLGADLIGFHVQAHCNNFLNTVDRTLEARVDWEHFSVKRMSHWSKVLPFPISVDLLDEPASPNADTSSDIRSALCDELGIDAAFLGVGVDRVDYTKGIVERFLAVESFLQRHPRYQGKFTFVQIGAPSRSNIPRYAEFQREVEDEANRINESLRRGRWKPIVFLNRQHSHAEVDRFYKAAHVCLVTSLHDGMNLVAKEYVASRDDEGGVLILSRFTGAARELTDALIINPYDVQRTGETIAQALEMDTNQINDRMRRMRRAVREHNIYWWAAALIGELCDLRVDRAPEQGA